MSIPSLSDLVTFVGTSISGNNWNTNWSKLVNWLTDTTANLSFGSFNVTSNSSMGGAKITNLANPTSTLDAANKAYVDSSGLAFVTCSTASATAAKTVSKTGFTLTTGIKIRVTFSNANTADAPTLNVESTGAIAIVNASGNIASATYPFYVPANVTVEFTYNGTYWVYTNTIVNNYVNGTSWYEQWADGKIKQGGFSTIYNGTLTFLANFKNTNYTFLASAKSDNVDQYSVSVANEYSGSRTVSSIGVLCKSANYTTGDWSSLGFNWKAEGY